MKKTIISISISLLVVTTIIILVFLESPAKKEMSTSFNLNLTTENKSKSALSEKQIENIALKKTRELIELEEPVKIKTYYGKNGKWAVEVITSTSELDGTMTIIIDEKSEQVEDYWLGTVFDKTW